MLLVEGHISKSIGESQIHLDEFKKENKGHKVGWIGNKVI